MYHVENGGLNIIIFLFFLKKTKKENGIFVANEEHDSV